MIWRGIDLGPVTLQALARNGAAGRNWYQDSWEQIELYASAHGFDPVRCSDVLAILSPRVTVEHSIRLADSYLRTGRAKGAMGQRLQALARYETSGLFNGPKVNAFAQALQGDWDAVVVDAWMHRACCSDKPTVKAHRAAVERIRECSDVLGWPARETQAAIWQGARSFVGYAQGYKPMDLGAVTPWS